MKKRFYYILAFIIASSFAACDSYLINGDLDGMWQLQTIEQQEPKVTIKNQGNLFYSFQRHSVLIGDYDKSQKLVGHVNFEEQYTCLFEYAGDSITMGEFHYYYVDQDKLAPVANLKKFGLYEKETTFYIEELTPNRLVLRSDSAVLTMRKY